jgi:acetyl-CoA carboxylase carboxyl transferase subunit beta
VEVRGNGDERVTLCAGAVIVDSDGRILLVLRRNEPSRGCWSVPGGRVEKGESLEVAARREVFEETGLTAEIGNELGVVQQQYVDSSGQRAVLEIHDFAAVITGGELAAGDDALDVRWHSRSDAGATQLTPGLLQFLDDFSVPLR